MSGNDRVSPTAHLTAAVWHANGLSPRGLTTAPGRAAIRALAPVNALYRLRGHRGLDEMLLARHRLIDNALRGEIDAGRVTCVLELAAGLSARGTRTTTAYPNVRYLESDLPAMAARKRAMLKAAVVPAPNHHVIEVDALAERGQLSIEAALSGLAADTGVAVITEGLLPYLSDADLRDLWRRLATTLRRFRHGIYLTDVNPRADVGSARGARLLHSFLRVLVGSNVTLHFRDGDDIRSTAAEAGFASVDMLPAVDANGRTTDGRRPIVRVALARA